MELKGTPKARANAKRLRREMSLPEVLLWQQLRHHETYRFRRQHPAGPYDLDFHCARARLVIEVDGEHRSRGDRPVKDAGRDAWLAERGVRTVRVPASAILRDLGAVLAHIDAQLVDRPPPPPG